MAEDCDYNPEFFVKIDDNSGCYSKSNIGTVNLLDTISPTTEITDVSVNLDGKATVTWTPSLVLIFMIYIKLILMDCVNITTVPSTENSYLDFNSNASSNFEKFFLLGHMILVETFQIQLGYIILSI